MTPLKPIENTTRVRGVLADRYPINPICSHPECDRPTESVHHIFGRPPGEHSDSWFVEVEVHPPTGQSSAEAVSGVYEVIPAATGLCGHGTAGHHGDVDSGMGGHQAWIKYEDGVFVWYAREMEGPGGEVYWRPVGPLNPQPGGREKTKKRRRKTTEERKTRRTISIAVPEDAQENGGEVWDDLLGDGKDDRPYGRVRERLDLCGVDGKRSPYYVIVDALNDWLNG